jgi:hypothetical protein
VREEKVAPGLTHDPIPLGEGPWAVLTFAEASPLERYLVDHQPERSQRTVSSLGDCLQHAGLA